ncbi:MAG TPA: MFS transporter [Polyangiaceae bacterium]|nr:MFS transporter [Polyangiaceae bacterium]
MPAKNALLDLGRVRRALRHPNYRLFFIGQGVSLIGTWLTRVALGWWVFRLTGSELILGTVSFAGQLPTFLLAPLGGVVVDRYDRHRLLVLTQVLAMLQSVLLTLLALSGQANVAYILSLAVFQGLINAFDTPARQSFIVELVEAREDLPIAIALNSSMVNAARLVGPSFAGLLIAAFGEAGCFAIDSLSYLAVIASLLAMKVPKRERVKSSRRMFGDLGAGLAYAARSAPISAILLLVALVSLTGAPYTMLMPVLASQTLGGGAYTLGFLMAAAGAGAVMGALWLASRPSVLGLGRVMVITSLSFGVGLVLLSLARSLWIALPLLLVTGAGMMITLAASNTLLQTIVDEDKRGRVMSLYTMAFFGMVPFGSLLAGWLANHVGAPVTIFGGGVLTALGGLTFWRQLPALRRAVRPIYVRLGILPEAEVARGLQDAADMMRPPER